MSKFGSLLLGAVVAIALLPRLEGLNITAQKPAPKRDLKIICYSEQGDTVDYTEYDDLRPNGIGKLKMSVKLLPNTLTSNNSYLLGYKAEITLNPQAELTEERLSKHGMRLVDDKYEVEFVFALMDEDGFRLDTINTDSRETSYLYTTRFEILSPGESQVEQAIITSHKISPLLADRVKKVLVTPILKRMFPKEDATEMLISESRKRLQQYKLKKDAADEIENK